MTNVRADIGSKRWSTPIDQAISELAGRQHGVVALFQLVDLGIGRGAIKFRLRCGRLHRIRRGVYAVGHTSISQAGKRLASALTYGDDAAVTHRAAGSHWQLFQSTAIEVTVPRTVRPRDTITTHCLPLPPDEVTVRDGVPVTTVVRTIFDLGIYGRRTVEKAIREAEHRRYADDLTLADLLERYPHRKGAAVIRAVRHDGTSPGQTESGLEDLFQTFLDNRGLPRGSVNVWIQAGDRWIRGDVVYRAERVIVELDGSTHDTQGGRLSDNRRDVAAQAEGWRVMRVGKHALLHEPDAVESDLLRLLRAP